ncbi:MAG: hypothetical protein HY815_12295 [Candidatus Riflebacteria bacterium]|nr:hypothetical protein [Candidatus Riflebacteria bacterium]
MTACSHLVSTSRTAALIALATTLLWTTRSGASDLAGLSSELADCNVGLRMAPSPVFKGLAMTIPVAVREFRPRTQADADVIKALMPTPGEMRSGWQWDFSHGFGQLMPIGGTVPCRVFVMEIDPLHAPTVKAKIQASAPFVYETPGFQKTIQVLGAAVFKTNSSDLTSMFPDIPMSLGPPSLGTSLAFVASHSSSPSPELTGTFVFDGTDATFQRGLALAGLSRDRPPRPKPPAHWIDDARMTLEGVGKGDYTEFTVWTGAIPSGAWTVGVKDTLSVTLSAQTAGWDYRVEPLPLALPDGTVDTSGVALPEIGSNRVEIHLTALPLLLGGELRSALIQMVLRAWRWRKILTAPAEPVTQTLLRLNEPLFEYICLSTAERRMKPISKPLTEKPPPRLDAVGEALLDARVGAARSQATAPAGAHALHSSRPTGTRKDSFYPCCAELLDYQMNALFVTAMDGGLGLKAFLRRSRPEDAARREASRKAAQSSLANQLVDLVAAGFHRPQRDLPLSDTLEDLDGRGAPGIADPTLEPDLVWLASATTGVSPSSALVNPLAALEGTRPQKTLSALVSAGVRAVLWTRLPEFDPARHYFLLTQETLPSLTAPLSFMRWKYAASGEKSARVKADGRASGYSDEWWRSSAYSTVSTSGDKETFLYMYIKQKLDTQRATLTAAVPTVGQSFQCLAFSGELDGKPGSALTPVTPTRAADAVASAVRLNLEAIDALDPNPDASRREFATRVLPAVFLKSDRVARQSWATLLIGRSLSSDSPADPVALLRLVLTSLAQAGEGQATLVTTAGNEVLR